MQNVQITVKDNVATITIKLDERHGDSKTGKTEIVASTHGNQQIPGTNVTLGLNAYVRK